MTARHRLAALAAVAAAAVGAAIIHCSMAAQPTSEDRDRARRLAAEIDRLRPLHRAPGEPQPGDWRLGPGAKERGQTFAEYLRCEPVRPVGRRSVLYIQPLGDFTKTQRRIVELAADFMGRYFGLTATIKEDLPLSLVPARARRIHPTWGVAQILTTYVLEEVLAGRLPDDAAAYIAFTASDLWPGEGWNFVFGQASLRRRVGVWSIYRNGDPTRGEAGFRACLLRTIKTATHETGHMFSMEHCIAYECNMCGSNHREESDRRPPACCPECVAKVCWATRTELIPRYRKLLEFARRQGLKEDAATYEKSILALGGQVEPPPATAPAAGPGKR